MKLKESLRKKRVRILGGFLIFIGILTLINFIPTFSLKTKGMHKLEGNWITVYYEKEAAAAKDALEYADPLVERIASKLGFTKKPDVNVYIYDSQYTMQTKKYGLIAPMLGLDWYIGDNIGTDVLLTSPEHPGKVHDYFDVMGALPHEITHAYVSVLNKDIQLWLTEGMALYLTNGQQFSKKYIDEYKIPTYEQTCTSNPLTFEKANGYMYAHTYIEFIKQKYDWDTVLKLLKTQDYKKCFGKSREKIYDEWVEFIKTAYLL